MGNEEFYLNDKLVSVHLYYMEENTDFKWTDEYYKPGFFSRKKVKLPKHYWIELDEFMSGYYTYLKMFETDKELLEHINPIGGNIYSIRHKQVILNPRIVFNYVNGDKKTVYFNKNSEAEKYYKEFKNQYNNNQYLIFN